MAGTEREPLPGASNNIEAFLDHLKTGRNLSANTVASYRCDLFQFADFLDRAGIDDLGKVDHKLLRSFLANQQARGYARSTVSRRCACLSRGKRGWLPGRWRARPFPPGSEGVSAGRRTASTPSSARNPAPAGWRGKTSEVCGRPCRGHRSPRGPGSRRTGRGRTCMKRPCLPKGSFRSSGGRGKLQCCCSPRAGAHVRYQPSNLCNLPYLEYTI